MQAGDFTELDTRARWLHCGLGMTRPRWGLRARQAVSLGLLGAAAAVTVATSQTPRGLAAQAIQDPVLLGPEQPTQVRTFAVELNAEALPSGGGQVSGWVTLFARGCYPVGSADEPCPAEPDGGVPGFRLAARAVSGELGGAGGAWDAGADGGLVEVTAARHGVGASVDQEPFAACVEGQACQRTYEVRFQHPGDAGAVRIEWDVSAHAESEALGEKVPKGAALTLSP